ncbi:MAG: ribonuclease M5 [Erysipelotrichaceae bacterium]|nr:ribonuclease M5 [Erysipelotrichaceae bacterium]
MKWKEVIIVEGKHDSENLKKYIDCDTIETQGTHLSKQTLQLIKKVQEKRGVIIFTDPDTPGEKIRQRINQSVPGCKNAFIDRRCAKTKKKVGIEHASKEDLLEALGHLMTYQENEQETLSFEDFIDLGFHGQQESSYLREKISRFLFLGKPNAKTLFKRLNMLQLTKEDIEQIWKEIS